MESTAYFEKKVSLTPMDFNKLKDAKLEDILAAKSKDLMENKCSEHGFVLPGSVKLLSRSMGYFEAARFTGDAVYYVKLEGRVVYPADGVRVTGEVIRKNKMGLYVDYNKAIRVQVPRDLHLGNEEFDSVEIGDTVQVELKRSKFQINDPYILASGIFLTKGPDAFQPAEEEKKGEEAEAEAEEEEAKTQGGAYDEEEEEEEDEDDEAEDEEEDDEAEDEDDEAEEEENE